MIYRPGSTKKWVFLGLRMVLIGIVFGWFYAWATPRFYPPRAGSKFLYGVMHGALMPMALPSLVMGQDVTIYAPDKTTRGYKLGYTIGINLCGLVFFGFLFARPRGAAPPSKTSPDILLSRPISRLPSSGSPGKKRFFGFGRM